MSTKSLTEIEIPFPTSKVGHLFAIFDICFMTKEETSFT